MSISDIFWTLFFIVWIYLLIAPKGLGKVPRMRYIPPPPPIKKRGVEITCRCKYDNIKNTTPKCNFCGLEIKAPEFPEDRIN